MIFAGGKKDLERLDALCVERWQAATRAARVGDPLVMTRVRSGGRLHPWPGDPDNVAALLMERGFRCHFELHRPSGDVLTQETIVIVSGIAT